MVIDELSNLDFATWAEARDAARKVLVPQDLKHRKRLTSAIDDVRAKHAELLGKKSKTERLLLEKN